jgi:pyrroline-5-carboxylate reductase
MSIEELSRKKFAFFGGGIIAGVFIERLLSTGLADPGRIVATDINPERLEALHKQHGIQASESNLEGARQGDVLFLATPPSAVEAVVAEISPALRNGHLLVSLAAAVPTWIIEEAARKPVPVVRVIPNTPSLIGRGMNPYCLGRHVSPCDLEWIDTLLRVFGETLRVEETLMNAATALTAVGPTYVFPVLQALQDNAAANGFPPTQARLAAAHTVAGTAELVLATGKDPEVLKGMIGTRTIDEARARSLVTAAFDAALARIAATARKVAG